MTRLICVTGPDGSGKSTQVELLTRALATRGHSVLPCGIWDLFEQGGEVRPFESKQDIDRYLGALDGTSRAFFLFHAMYGALDRALRERPDVVLLNAYWYKYFATEIAHGTAQERLLPLVSVFPRPERTFYLKLDPRTALGRKKRLSGYETGFRGAEGFLPFQAKAHRALESLADEWRVIDGRGSIEEINAALSIGVCEVIDAHLPQ